MRTMECEECGKPYTDRISNDAVSVICPECCTRQLPKPRMGDLMEAVNSRSTKDWRGGYDLLLRDVANLPHIPKALVRKLGSREKLSKDDRRKIYKGVLEKYWRSDPGHNPPQKYKQIVIRNWVDSGGGL